MHVTVGTSNDHVGILFDGVHLGSEGFKEIDAGQLNTGFVRTEGIVRGFLQTDPGDELFNRLEMKLGYSREQSNETYLGLSDADFQANPNRRYASSQLDQMNWWRSSVSATHILQAGDDFELRTDLYRNDFDRSWRRLNRFRNGPELLDVLSDPEGPQNRVFYEVLTGARDSASTEDPAQDQEDLMVIDNDRRFLSQGVQTKTRFDFETGAVTHEVEAGVRLHYDRIDRDHQEQGYQMQNLQLVLDGRDRTPIDDNTGTSLAFAGYAVYALTFFDVTLTPGIRIEAIHNTFESRIPADPTAPTVGEVSTDQAVAIPGIGANWSITDEVSVLAGLHRGFSPVAPGQPEEVQPETSINYEVGGRVYDADAGSLGELIFFFNDYENITGQCGGSTGCPPDLIDRQFNGGAASVLGFEAAGVHRFDLGDDLGVPVRLAYTFTHGEFRTSFNSQNPTFGDVEAGDQIPYVPQHQGQLQVGIDRGEAWHLRASATYVGAMREEAGGGDPDPSRGELPKTDDYVLLDVVAGYRVFERLYLYTRLENILNSRPIAARRPFGARPVRPFMVQVGVRVDI
ncbi:MAG: TonB-dependent receptor [Deltaproteobacteria bacterium]|nr:TonB-dependent receptor [Deltaproteobacteria bacterium]